MCGIAGFIYRDSSSRADLEATAFRMSEPIVHRGPDDVGVWCCPDFGIGLAHRRLAILDLSPAGHQPMSSPSGRYVMIFNGEIYNHHDIRRELAERPDTSLWRGHSDTETMLAGFDVWGIETTVRKTVGMFALAIWDNAERTLTIGRDRMGEKPLYFGWANGTFLFASETKSLCRHPHFAPTINRHALTLLLRHNYITAPYSIYRGIYKLKPGTLLTVVGAEQCHCPWEPDDPPFESYRGNGVFFRPYWSLDDAVANGQAQPFDGTEHDAVEALERVLSDAIVSQQISDVPLGAFLSGGVDSSTIVALMQAHSSRPVKTFTIGFREPGYNEAEFAKEVARHLGTNHTELYVTPEDARNVIPLLPTMYDEPFADSSQIPTFLVSRMAKQHVTVALSGDAGDELFGGYSRYFQTRAIATKLSRLPLPARKLVANCLKSVPVGVWNSVLGPLEQCTPRAFRGGIPGDRIHKGADILATEHMEQLYREFISQWKSPAEVVIDSREPLTALTRDLSFPGIREFEHRMMYLDSVTYLPDDILVKVDRAAMAVSLETRVPFLDHRVVEFAWRLPLAFKMRGDIGKWLLRQVLYKYVPSSLIERPKTGFAVPIDIWLRGPLREWGESLLDEKRMNQDGIFNSAEIRRKWNEHVSGTRNWHYYLWDILMFQAWKESTTQGGGI